MNMLYQEQDILSLKGHKNIQKIGAFYPGLSYYYIYVSEYMPNKDLGTLFRKVNTGLLKLNNPTTKIPESMVKYFGIQIAQALNYLNHCKIIHGNIKPSHFLVTNQLQLKLIDFSCSQMNEADVFFLKENRYKVDPKYQPYEYFRKEKSVDYRDADKIDVFGFGCILYYLTTGEALFQDILIAISSKDQMTIGNYIILKVKGLSKDPKLSMMSKEFISLLQSK
jgi:serine/threonine protein kinase